MFHTTVILVAANYFYFYFLINNSWFHEFSKYFSGFLFLIEIYSKEHSLVNFDVYTLT